MKHLIKLPILFATGGVLYAIMELLWRGHTHWTMIIVGGFCFVLLGLINELYPWGMALVSQMLISALLITVVEYITGLLVNVWLGWGVWDYSHMPYNLHGQICLLYSNLWFVLSAVGIVLDDWLRYWIDRLLIRLGVYVSRPAPKPRYKIL